MNDINKLYEENFAVLKNFYNRKNSIKMNLEDLEKDSENKYRQIVSEHRKKISSLSDKKQTIDKYIDIACQNMTFLPQSNNATVFNEQILIDLADHINKDSENDTFANQLYTSAKAQLNSIHKELGIIIEDFKEKKNSLFSEVQVTSDKLMLDEQKLENEINDFLNKKTFTSFIQETRQLSDNIYKYNTEIDTSFSDDFDIIIGYVNYPLYVT